VCSSDLGERGKGEEKEGMRPQNPKTPKPQNPKNVNLFIFH